MDLYIWRLRRIGFSVVRSYEVCWQFRRNRDYEGLDKYITELEDCWSIELCG